MKDPKFRKALWLIAFGVCLFALLMNYAALGDALTWLMGVLSPLLLGAGIALILNVPLRGFTHLLEWLDRKRKRLSERACNNISMTLTLLFTPLVIFFVIRFVVPQLTSAIMGVISLVTTNRGAILDAAEKIGLATDTVNSLINQVTNWISDNMGTLTGAAVSTVVNVFSSATSVIMSVMLAIYLLIDKPRVIRQSKKLLAAFATPKISDWLTRFASLFVRSFSTFLSRQCLEACILGALILSGMLLFGIPYAISLSVLTAVLALIPYVGAYLSFFIGVVMLVLIDPTKAMIFAVWFLVAQQIEGNVIYPHVVGESVGLPAYVTLMAVTLGGALFGIAGMFFIIPVASVAYTLISEGVQHRLAVRQTEGQA